MADRLVRKAGHPVLSHETIYRFIDAQLRRTQDYAWRQTVTFENGTEFAQYQQLRALAMHTYFCDPHAPWQKGRIENAIGRLRRTLPRKTDLRTVTPAVLRALIPRYNHTPRACLDYQTPAEVFGAQLLHFNCDSTFRLASE